MISAATINRIIDTTRIEEVVGDFVQLKRRGVNMQGLCPFHNEKTPSFNVNPARNIYKCFGCGKAGNSVNFIMEHEHVTYPEALRYLAKKYNIEIEETYQENKEEYEQEQKEKEGLYVIHEFAQKYFSKMLSENEEGRSVAKTYFAERGFKNSAIEKFQLGFCPSLKSSFSEYALRHGYKEEQLVASGLSIKDEEKIFDRFKGRIIFPIHNLSGRVIAFGARIIRKDQHPAKYINSPETSIYQKSKVLYGISFARKAISDNDLCYLVEGYTDVISMHEAGIENVVASAGTSLTQEQVRLIGRFTKNVTILYDGDAAGISASERGINLILEEGLNVKIVLLPAEHDPDSFAKTFSATEVKEYLNINAQDFILFKTQLQSKSAGDDPVKKISLLHDIVETIARIPDPMMRMEYMSRCSRVGNFNEQILIGELNKELRKKYKKFQQAETPGEHAPQFDEQIAPLQPIVDQDDADSQERDILRLLLNYASHEISFPQTETTTTADGTTEWINVQVAYYIIRDLERDEIIFSNKMYSQIYSDIKNIFLSQNSLNEDYFLNHIDVDVREFVSDLLSEPYELSVNWSRHGITVPTEKNVLRAAVEGSLYSLKIRKVMKMMHENRERMDTAFKNGEDIIAIMQRQHRLEALKMKLSKALGIDVLK
jgi:DNA primase